MPWDDVVHEQVSDAESCECDDIGADDVGGVVYVRKHASSSNHDCQNP